MPTAGNTAVTLNWTASSGATGYHVKRATTSGGPYTQVGVATGTTFTDSGLASGTYFYVVRAANSSTCESGNSPQASATVTVAPNFSLSISPASATIPLLGSTTTYTVTITRTGGFSGAVTLSVAGLPSGGSATFTPRLRLRSRWIVRM